MFDVRCSRKYRRACRAGPRPVGSEGANCVPLCIVHSYALASHGRVSQCPALQTILYLVGLGQAKVFLALLLGQFLFEAEPGCGRWGLYWRLYGAEHLLQLLLVSFLFFLGWIVLVLVVLINRVLRAGLVGVWLGGGWCLVG